MCRDCSPFSVKTYMAVLICSVCSSITSDIYDHSKRPISLEYFKIHNKRQFSENVHRCQNSYALVLKRKACSCEVYGSVSFLEYIHPCAIVYLNYNVDLN